MERRIPKIKKKVNAFLVGEEGKISKESLMKVGLIVGGAAIGTLIAAKTVNAHASHSNTLSLTNNPASGADASHANHGSHSSHGSHGSHGSHSSWGGW